MIRWMLSPSRVLRRLTLRCLFRLASKSLHQTPWRVGGNKRSVQTGRRCLAPWRSSGGHCEGLFVAKAAGKDIHEQISKCQVKPLPVEALKPNPKNAKEHPEKQIVLLMENMSKFGFIAPIVIISNRSPLETSGNRSRKLGKLRFLVAIARKNGHLRRAPQCVLSARSRRTKSALIPAPPAFFRQAQKLTGTRYRGPGSTTGSAHGPCATMTAPSARA